MDQLLEQLDCQRIVDARRHDPVHQPVVQINLLIGRETIDDRAESRPRIARVRARLGGERQAHFTTGYDAVDQPGIVYHREAERILQLVVACGRRAQHVEGQPIALRTLGQTVPDEAAELLGRKRGQRIEREAEQESARRARRAIGDAPRPLACVVRYRFVEQLGQPCSVLTFQRQMCGEVEIAAVARLHGKGIVERYACISWQSGQMLAVRHFARQQRVVTKACRERFA